VHDAPDNPPNIPRGPSPGSGTDSRRNLPKSRMTRQSSRLWPTTSTILDTEGRHLSTPNNYDVIERQSDRKSNHDQRSAQNDSSRHRSSALTPIEAVEDLRTRPTESPNKRPRSESPSTDEEQVVDSDDQQSQRLRQLEEDARIAYKHLKRARSEFEDERSRSPRYNNKTGSPLNMSGSHPNMRSSDPQHTRVPDETISQAICNLHTPTHREGKSQREYDARIAASSRFNLEPENMTQTDQSRLRKDQPQVGAESLLLEVKELEMDQKRHERHDANKRRKTSRARKEAHRN
jgi:hypothetical protein